MKFTRISLVFIIVTSAANTLEESQVLKYSSTELVSETLGPKLSGEQYEISRSIAIAISNQIDEVDALIENFHLKLMSVASWARFDSAQFEALATLMDSELTSIQELLEQVPSMQELIQKLDFISHMFRTMVEASQILADYKADKNVGSSLICYVCELEIRLFALHDVHGMPDFQQPGYAFKVLRLQSILADWKKQFALKHTLSEHKTVFWLYSNYAEKTLEKLKSYIALKWYPA